MNFEMVFFTTGKKRSIIEHKVKRKGNTITFTAKLELEADSKEAKKIINQSIDKQVSPIEIYLKKAVKERKYDQNDGLSFPDLYEDCEEIDDLVDEELKTIF